MKISEYFSLGTNFDFYDVDIDKDNYRFIDPHYVRTLNDDFCKQALTYIDSFFKDFLIQFQNDNLDGAKNLLDHFHELNNTRLGMSKDAPNGKAIGKINADQIFGGIVSSDLFIKGIANQFEDISVYLKGIDKDKMSDMVTNIIKEPLAIFTHEQCKKHNIPCKDFEIEYWNPNNFRWEKSIFELPFDNEGEYLLFVPKNILCIHTAYNFRTFLYKSILPFYKEIYIKDKKPLVKKIKLKNGQEKCFINKKDILKDLQKNHVIDKDFAINFTKEHPELLKKFKQMKMK